MISPRIHTPQPWKPPCPPPNPKSACSRGSGPSTASPDHAPNPFLPPRPQTRVSAAPNSARRNDRLWQRRHSCLRSFSAENPRHKDQYAPPENAPTNSLSVWARLRAAPRQAFPGAGGICHGRAPTRLFVHKTASPRARVRFAQQDHRSSITSIHFRIRRRPARIGRNRGWRRSFPQADLNEAARRRTLRVRRAEHWLLVG